MVCPTCQTAFDDNSRFCPRCGAAKPDTFASGSEKPFFVDTDYDKSTRDASNRAGNSGPPYSSEQGGFSSRHRQSDSGVDRGYTPYRPPSLNTQGSGSRANSANRANDAGRANNTQKTSQSQQYYYTESAPPNQRTFDDKSVRQFLVGFTVVSVAVVALVAALVVISGAW